MIKFGIRQSFDRIEQIEDRYSNLKAPVEVALPYYWDIYEAVNLPMTLDISHVHDNEKIWNLLKKYRDNILNVHLSARTDDKQHLPVDAFCKEAMRYLIDNKWSGNVILEYLPEFHNRILDDLKILEAMK